MAKRKYIYFAEIERFGYMLQCVGLSAEEVKQAMIDEYIKTFKNCNDGIDPRDEDMKEDYYDVFLEELWIEKREINKVEWT